MNSACSFLFLLYTHFQHIFNMQPLLFLSQLIFLEWENPLPFHSIKYSKIRRWGNIHSMTQNKSLPCARWEDAILFSCDPMLCRLLTTHLQAYMGSGMCCLAYALCDILGKTDAQPLKNVHGMCWIFKSVFKSCHLIIFTKF